MAQIRLKQGTLSTSALGKSQFPRPLRPDFPGHRCICSGHLLPRVKAGFKSGCQSGHWPLVGHSGGQRWSGQDWVLPLALPWAGHLGHPPWVFVHSTNTAQFKGKMGCCGVISNILVYPNIATPQPYSTTPSGPSLRCSLYMAHASLLGCSTASSSRPSSSAPLTRWV